MPTSSTASTSSQNGLLGTFFSTTGQNPRPTPADQAYTPWEASVDRAPPPPASDVASLAFGGGNFTQSRAYRMANLPPYNSRGRGRRRPGSSSCGPFGSHPVFETLAALLIVGGTAYTVCKLL